MSSNVKPIYYTYDLLLSGVLANKAKYEIRNFNFQDVLFVMNVKAGSNDEKINGKFIHGLAHLMEHIFYTFDNEEDNFISNITKTNGNYNASTDNQLTQYFFYCHHSIFIKMLKMFFSIFTNIKDHINEKIIKSQIIAINNEFEKTKANDINKVYDIFKNEIIDKNHNKFSTGNMDTLNIVNIVEYCKYFFDNYYVSENLRFVILVNKKYKLEQEILNILKDFDKNFKFPVFSKDYNFLLEKSNNMTNNIINNSTMIKNIIPRNKILEIINNNNVNTIFIFFQIPKYLNNYFRLFSWLINHKNNYSLYSALKQSLDVLDIYSSIIERRQNIIICCFVISILPSVIKNIDVLYSFIQSYFNDLNLLNDDQLKEILSTFLKYRIVLLTYDKSFNSSSFNTMIDTIRFSLDYDFNCYNPFLPNDDNMTIQEFKDFLRLLDLNNMCCVHNFSKENSRLSYLKDLKKSKYYNNEYNIHNFKINNINSYDKMIYNNKIFDFKEENDNLKTIINFIPKDKDNILKNINNNGKGNNNKNKNFQFSKILNNNIKLDYEISNQPAFETCANIKIKLNQHKNLNEIYLRFLFIIKGICEKLNNDYAFLQSTGSNINFSFHNNYILLNFTILNKYFVEIIDKFLQFLFFFVTNDNEKYKDIIESDKYFIDVNKYLIKKTNISLLESVKYFIPYFYNDQTVDYYSMKNKSNKILNIKITDLSLKSIKFYILTNNNNYVKINDIINIINKYDFKIKIKKENNNENNVIKDIIKNKYDKFISIFDFYNKNFINLIQISQNNNKEISFTQLKSNKNINDIVTYTKSDVILVISILSKQKIYINDDKVKRDFIKNIRELFYLHTIKNIISDDFFNVFRTQKGYSYIFKIKRNYYYDNISNTNIYQNLNIDNVNNNLLTYQNYQKGQHNNIIRKIYQNYNDLTDGLYYCFDIMIMINKNDKYKYNINFFKKYYLEVREFLLKEEEKIKNIDLENFKKIFFRQFTTCYSGIYETLQYKYTIKEIFNNNITEETIIRYLNNIKLTDLIDYYKNQFVNNTYNLLII